MNKLVKYYTLFLIVLYVLSFTQSARRVCRRRTNERKHYVEDVSERKNSTASVEDVLEVNEEDDGCDLYEPGEIDNHLPAQNCYYGTKMKGKVINPFRTYESRTQDIFKSACIKCAICLAVAQSMNETLQEYYGQNFYSQCPENCLCKVLEPVCTSGFKNYDLREVNEDILLTGSSPNSKRVATSFYGSWTEKLRETCHKYLNNMECDLDDRLKSGGFNFVEYLCNGDGIFRDCRNIELKLVEIPDRDSNLCVKCN